MVPDNLDPSDAPQNPYAAPQDLAGEADQNAAFARYSYQTRGMVGHAVVLGIFMIVQGVLNFIAGIGAAFYAVFMPMMIANMQQQAAQRGGQVPPPIQENMGMVFAVGGGVIAAVMIPLGLLMIYCGISVTKFQNRKLTMVALSTGLITLFTCYCFPSSLALAIYGLIFVLNQPVTAAFNMRSEGRSVEEIKRLFLSQPR